MKPPSRNPMLRPLILFLSISLVTPGLRADPAPAPVKAFIPAQLVHGGEIQDLAGFVNPFVGVRGVGFGDTMPGTALPNGSVHPSPQTIPNGSSSGYHFTDEITGFAQTHAQGTGGILSYGNFLVSPQVGPVQIAEADHKSPKANEIARADSYGVDLTRYGVRAEFAPAHFSTIYRFTFPETTSAQLLIDVTRKLGGTVASSASDVQIDPTTGQMTGRVRANNQWNPSEFDLYFCARFSKPPTAVGTAKAGALSPGQSTATAGKDEALAAYATFATTAGETISLKIAVSFRSVAQAEAELDAEIPAFDFDAVRASAKAAWDQALSGILVEGLSAEEKARFYTAFYHAMIQPRNRTGDNFGTANYASFYDDHYTLWDSYRTLYPMLALLRPSIVTGVVNSFCEIFEHTGEMDTAFVHGSNFWVGQGGDEVDNVIADAYARGVPGIDWERAYAVMKHHAEHRRSASYRTAGWFPIGEMGIDGFRPRSGSSTLGFAFNDYNVAQVAAGLGKTADAATYLARSHNWKNVWDPAATSDGYTGFIRSRGSDGVFGSTDPKTGWVPAGKDKINDFYHKNVDFYEGSSWIYSYSLYFDPEEMIARMGGRVRFLERLEHAFDNGLIEISNEPSFLTPFLFHFIGRPELSAKWARTFRDTFTALSYPGDEDNGAMGSHYVLNTLGIFPVAGTDRFFLHGPRFPKTTLQMENGRVFVIEGVNASAENLYVQSALLNGVALTRPWLRHSEIAAGGKLTVVMGATPGRWVFPGAVTSAMPDARPTARAHFDDDTAPARAFDDKASTVWRDDVATPTWLRLDYPGDERRALGAYTVTVGPADPERDPRDWQLQGSNDDGATWTTLDTRSGETFPQRMATRTFTFANANTTAYRAHRLLITAAASGNVVQVAEVELLNGPLASTATATPTASSAQP